MNVLEKLKSRNPRVTESRSFLVRYNRTYGLNKHKDSTKDIQTDSAFLLSEKCLNCLVSILQ